MSAGLPGLGLGGLFFILSALVAPFFELGRMARGRSSAASRRTVARQFAQAALMVAAVDLTLRLAYVCLSALGLADPPPADAVTVLPMTLIGITAGLLALVLCAAKAMEFVSRPAELPAPVAAPARAVPLRALLATGAVAGAWFVLLSFGASDLSPLSGNGQSSEAAPPGLKASSEPEAPTIASRAAGEAGSTPTRAAASRRSIVPEGGPGPPTPALSGTDTQVRTPSAAAPSTEGQTAQLTTANATTIGPGSASGPDSPAATGPITAPSANGSGGGHPAEAGPPAESSAPESAGPPDDPGRPASKPANGRGLGQTR
jgi:hypothetical protein